MEFVFWLKEGTVAGRTGPNTNPWKLDELVKGGFSAILSVNDGELCHIKDIEGAGLNYACIPMSENAPPRHGDKELCLLNLPKAFQYIKNHISKGVVLIHCRSGKDRTGLVMAYFMCKEYGLSVKQAMDYVLQVRPIAFSAENWIEYCTEILDECNAV